MYDVSHSAIGTGCCNALELLAVPLLADGAGLRLAFHRIAHPEAAPLSATISVPFRRPNFRKRNQTLQDVAGDLRLAVILRSPFWTTLLEWRQPCLSLYGSVATVAL